MRLRTKPQTEAAPPLPYYFAASREVVSLIDETLASLASGESAVPRREVVDAFLDLRLAVETIDAVERYIAGDEGEPPASADHQVADRA